MLLGLRRGSSYGGRKEGGSRGQAEGDPHQHPFLVVQCHRASLLLCLLLPSCRLSSNAHDAPLLIGTAVEHPPGDRLSSSRTVCWSLRALECGKLPFHQFCISASQFHRVTRVQASPGDRWAGIFFLSTLHSLSMGPSFPASSSQGVLAVHGDLLSLLSSRAWGTRTPCPECGGTPTHWLFTVVLSNLRAPAKLALSPCNARQSRESRIGWR